VHGHTNATQISQNNIIRALPADVRENVHSTESSSCSIQGESDTPTNACICAENRQAAVDTGTAVRAVPHSG